MNIRIASSDQDLLSLAPVLLQLRPQYNTASLISQIKKQQPDGYQVAIVEMDNTVACVAGFVMNEKLAWGKCLYVDDLVTSETMRSRGAGKAMIGLVKTLCQGTGVPGITPGLGDASYRCPPLL